MSQDETRGLNKNLDFMRAISILFLVMNVYYFCYPYFLSMNLNIGVVDKILLNFQRDTGLFFPFAGEQVLQSALPFLLLHGSERTEGRGDVMKEYRLLPYSRDAALFW